MGTVNFSGWRPIRFYIAQGQVMVDWARLLDTPLREPFFQHGIQNQLRHPFHLAFRRQTPLHDLLAWHEQSPGLDPSLVIFHVSRCGSTLITQTLAESPHHLQLSEPGPVDFLVRQALASGLIDEAQVVRALRAWTSAWAQRCDSASPPLQTMSLKQDAWNTDKAPLFAKAWPDAPWVFLTREPLAVLVSQMRERAFFMIPGALGLNFGGVNPGEMPAMSAELHCAQVLGSIYAAMAQQFDPTRALLLDYAQLPDAIETQVLPHMRWQVSHADRERMRERATRHGKQPHEVFEPDTQTKHSMASDLLQSLTAQWIAPHYEKLHAQRRSHPAAVTTQSEEALQ